MDAKTFRSQFPKFGDETAYPDSQVSMWIGLGVIMLPAARWTTLLDHGVALFTAHHLALADRPVAAGGGAVSSKQVDKVSVSYDANIGLELNAGHWNLTPFGIQFINLARMAGMGGAQISPSLSGSPYGVSAGVMSGWP